MLARGVSMLSVRCTVCMHPQLNAGYLPRQEGGACCGLAGTGQLPDWLLNNTDLVKFPASPRRCMWSVLTDADTQCSEGFLHVGPWRLHAFGTLHSLHAPTAQCWLSASTRRRRVLRTSRDGATPGLALKQHGPGKVPCISA